MGTAFLTIKERFLNKIKDYDYSIIDENNPDYEDLEAIDKQINYFLISACSRCQRVFLKCGNKNLYDRDDDIEEFDDEYTDEEIDIIAMAMVLSWYEPYLHSSDLAKNQMHTKDFLTFSNSNQLDKMTALHKQIKIDFNVRLKDYSYAYGNIEEDWG